MVTAIETLIISYRLHTIKIKQIFHTQPHIYISEEKKNVFNAANTKNLANLVWFMRFISYCCWRAGLKNRIVQRRYMRGKFKNKQSKILLKEDYRSLLYCLLQILYYVVLSCKVFDGSNDGCLHWLCFWTKSKKNVYL